MKIFICDGKCDSFFSAVFDAYFQTDCIITSDSEVQLALDSQIVKVETDLEKSRRIQRGIQRYDVEGVPDVVSVLRSCDGLKEQIAFEYIKLVFERKAAIKKAYNLPQVIEFNDILYKVTGETHRMKGFLRFMESSSGALYAPYSPDNDITDLLMPHFAERFASEKFVIHDLKRKLAGMYDGHSWVIAHVGEAEVYLSEYEKTFETLWKCYYNAVNIKSRPHEKQMKGYMPVRYWKFLPEKN